MPRKKYKQSAGFMREFIALAVFVFGFAIYDAQHGSDGSRLAALLMMFGSAFFMCCAIVERLFFLPRIRGREDPANQISMPPDAPQNERNAVINYEGPRVHRVFAQDPHQQNIGPDGLDPIRPPDHYYDPADYAESAGAEEEEGKHAAENKAESEAEDEHVFHEEMKTTLTDSFFSDDKTDDKK